MSTSATAAEKLLASFLDNPPIAIISVVAALVIAAIFLAASGGQSEAVAASSSGSQPKMSKAKAQKKANQAAKKKAAAQKQAEADARADALAQAQDSDDEDSPSTATKSKKKRRKRSKKKKTPAAEVAAAEADIVADQGEEWSTVPKKVATKSKKKSYQNATGGSSAAADQEKKEIAVPSRKIGTIVGKAGSTINAIRDAAGVEINIQDKESTSGDTTIVTITGDADGVKFAVKIINETIKNNYCKLMKGEHFKEGSMSVPTCFHATLIGPKGVTIKKLKDIGNGVEISMPDRATGGERVRLGGDSDDIAKCKEAIDDLMKYTHSKIIDPALIHVELDIPESKLGRVIGTKGANVRHIQGTTGATVRTPDRRLGQYMNKNVILVGSQAQVNAAKKMIDATLAEAEAEAAARASAAEEREQSQWDSKTASEKTEVQADAWEAPAVDAEEDGW